MRRTAGTRGALGSTLASCIPDGQQPLWRRALFVTAVTTSLSCILPTPVVVSDVAAGNVGFRTETSRPAEAPSVWVVEETDTSQVLSNGLRIDTTYAARNEQRFYQPLDRQRNYRPTEVWYSEPVGIIFHTTESPQAPFAVDQNDALQRITRALLTHIQKNRSYHYVVDRFGRVYRVVEEPDTAFHAGNSVWAYGHWTYLNLNSSFLGVAFESAGDVPLNPAQVLSARLLTQMLRTKYRIPVENCVTHAQVSVNPANGRIGWHTDAGRNFPFIELGLADNYELPVVAVAEFGFSYDDAFLAAVGMRPWRGLQAAEKQLRNKDRTKLLERYRELYAALKLNGTADEGAARD